MTLNSDKILDPSAINGWHAHIYFDALNRDKAWELREIIEKCIGDKVAIGRFHEKPIGPHPDGSFQLAINNENFLHVFQWLVLNHGQLDVLVHPETGDDLRDHQISASWIGRSHEINLDKL